MNDREINFFLREKLLEYLNYRLEWRTNELAKIQSKLKNNTKKEKSKEDLSDFFRLKNEISMVKKRIEFENRNYHQNKNYPIFIGKTTFKKIIEADLGEKKITPNMKKSNFKFVDSYLNDLGKNKYFVDGSIINSENKEINGSWISGANYFGKKIFIQRVNYFGDNISIIEWIALKKIIYWLKNHNIRNGYILSDSLNNVNNFNQYDTYVRDNNQKRLNILEKRYQKLSLIIELIKDLNISIIWIPRDVNKADEILRNQLITSQK